MVSSTADNILEITFLTIIAITVVFLLCFVACKIKQCFNQSKVVLKDEFGKSHTGEQDYQVDAVNFVD